MTIIDKAFTARLQAFSDKHCRGKIARVDLLMDMYRALGLEVTVKVTHPALDQEGGRHGQEQG